MIEKFGESKGETLLSKQEKTSTMNERPNLDTRLDGKTFRGYYYLKEELIDFCHKHGLPVTGGKIELTDRIAHFLDTGELLPPSKKESRGNGAGEIDENTIIEQNVVYSEKLRAFFIAKIGKSLNDAIACRKYKKSLQGLNRYERADLVAIERKNDWLAQTAFQKDFFLSRINPSPLTILL